MTVVIEKLLEHGFLEGLHGDCVVYNSEPDNYVVLKKCVKDLMNLGVM